MKKIRFFTAIPGMLAAAFLCCFLSCNTGNLIPEPVMDNITGGVSADTSLKAPENVSAKPQGGYRAVTLTWSPVVNASYYYIYSANNAYDTLTKVGETKDASTTYEIKEKPGVTKYYSIVAVDYQKQTSTYSKKVMGSTLATPIIQDITAGSDGTNATVSWWMENCNSQTYLSSVKYEVNCYIKENGEIKLACEPITVSGDTTEVTFTGLTGKTTYYYNVDAYTSFDLRSVESSGLVDAETAHRTIPNPAGSFTASTGISQTDIYLSWTLPDFVDYSSSNGGYESHPVYFTLERKLSTADDDSYITVANYIGTPITNTKTEMPSTLKFFYSCTDDSQNSPEITVSAATDENAQIDDSYPHYISGSTVTFRDSSDALVQGKEYTYRIITYVDDTARSITTDTAKAYTEGWLIDVLSLSTATSYEKQTVDEVESFRTITISFEAQFDPKGISTYNYILVQDYTPFATDENPAPETVTSILKNTDSLSSIISEPVVFDCTAENFENTYSGYYKYSLYIVKPGITEIPSDPSSDRNIYSYAKAPGTSTVTSDSTRLPAITFKGETYNEHRDLSENGYFDVEEGFKDKFLIKWDYDSNCAYTLSWTENGTDSEYTFSDDELSSYLKTENSFTYVEYPHAADSGACRLYSLTADSGLAVKATRKNTAKTLGTANPVQSVYDYSTITVSWDEVQMAKSGIENYEISAKLNGTEILHDDIPEDTTVDPPVPAQPKNYSVTLADDTYTCVISKPQGYDDPLVSGKDIEFTVKASSSVQEGETSVNQASLVRTLGPALSDVKVNADSIDQSHITVTWNEIQGAEGYLIYRMLYSDGDGTSPYHADNYYYSKDGKEFIANVTGDGNDVTSDKAVIEKTGSVFTLKDIYCPASANDKYSEAQSKITWGLPYGYFVMPVLESEDFVFDEGTTNNMFAKTDTENPFFATDFTLKLGATSGYGLNVKAQKATSASSQTIEWDMPYYKTKEPTVYYRVATDTDYVPENNQWQSLGKANAGESSYTFTVRSTKDSNGNTLNPSTAYEYLIKYDCSYSTFTPTPSYVDELMNSNNYENRWTYSGDGHEQLCKGYLMYTGFTAKYNGTIDSEKSTADKTVYKKDENYYSEAVNWNTWDFTNRKLGPSSYTIKLLNLNISTNPVAFAVLGSDSKVSSITKPDYVEVTNTETSIKLIPVETTLKDGVISTENKVFAGSEIEAPEDTHGMLNVLRDAHHYYMLTMTRDDLNLSQTLSATAYRQVTPTEIAKHINLVIAEEMNKGTVTNSSSNPTPTTGEGGGTFYYYIKRNSGISLTDYLYWLLTDYTHKWVSNTSSDTKTYPMSAYSYLNLTDSDSERKGQWDANLLGKSGNHLRGIVNGNGNSVSAGNEDTVTFSGHDIDLESYSGSFGFSYSDSEIYLNVDCDDDMSLSVSSTDSEELKYWTPIAIGTVNTYLGTNANYGWWLSK